MVLDEPVATTLRELRERVEHDLPARVERIVLFGSVARGEATDDSILDEDGGVEAS